MKNKEKEEIKKIKEKSKGFFGEFKTFIQRGNVMDLAVGVVIGTAFSSIVNSLVNDIIMPLVGVIIGGYDFSGLSIKVKDATINYGMFIQNIINFSLLFLVPFYVYQINE